MANHFSHLNPIPSLPTYSGPYDVGTTDVEIPISELDDQNYTPNKSITSVQFRIFYPCKKEASHLKSVSWLPEPKRLYMDGFAKFAGAGPKWSKVFSYFPWALYYSTLPAIRNAPILLPSTKSGRWPVVFFSHGLGGTRNMYSHILGSLASYGTVSIAAEHRDGSCPVTFIRGNTRLASSMSSGNPIAYQSVPHTQSEEVSEIRNEQLRIRLWEIILIYNALIKIDTGQALSNLAAENSSQDIGIILDQFKGMLDIHRKGAVTWAGHSFGAATIVQFLKSVFYKAHSDLSGFNSLLPRCYEQVASQITPKSLTILLDLWCQPLEAASSRYLSEKPLPCYGDPEHAHALLICSETFRKWNSNFDFTKRILSSSPTTSKESSMGSNVKIFYVESSAHLSQSDIGILFPWASKRFLEAGEPARILQLNLRAILQMMRQCGIEISPPSTEDIANESISVSSDGQDSDILASSSAIRSWIPLNL